jgi:hypothetical protein
MDANVLLDGVTHNGKIAQNRYIENIKACCDRNTLLQKNAMTRRDRTNPFVGCAAAGR